MLFYINGPGFISSINTFLNPTQETETPPQNNAVSTSLEQIQASRKNNNDSFVGVQSAPGNERDNRSVADLISSLRNPNSSAEARTSAVDALSERREGLSNAQKLEVFRLLVPLLNNTNATLQSAAASALGMIGGNLPGLPREERRNTCTTLTGLLSSTDTNVVSSAAFALGMLGRDLPPADRRTICTALLPLLRNNTNASARANTAWTLSALGSDLPEVINQYLTQSGSSVTEGLTTILSERRRQRPNGPLFVCIGETHRHSRRMAESVAEFFQAYGRNLTDQQRQNIIIAVEVPPGENLDNAPLAELEGRLQSDPNCGFLRVAIAARRANFRVVSVDSYSGDIQTAEQANTRETELHRNVNRLTQGRINPIIFYYGGVIHCSNTPVPLGTNANNPAGETLAVRLRNEHGSSNVLSFRCVNGVFGFDGTRGGTPSIDQITSPRNNSVVAPVGGPIIDGDREYNGTFDYIITSPLLRRAGLSNREIRETVIDLTRRLTDQANVRRVALQELDNIEGRRVLISLLGDPDRRASAIDALAAINANLQPAERDEAITGLNGLLDTQNPTLERSVADTLGILGTNSLSAVRRLSLLRPNHTRETNIPVRLAAVNSLRNIAEHSQNAEVQLEAVNALINFRRNDISVSTAATDELNALRTLRNPTNNNQFQLPESLRRVISNGLER